MSDQVVTEWVIKSLFTFWCFALSALWCVALAKVSWSRYGVNRFLVGSFISSTTAVLLYQHAFVAAHQIGMDFFETVEYLPFGPKELFLSTLAQVVAIALLIIGIRRKFWPSPLPKNSKPKPKYKWVTWLICSLFFLPILSFSAIFLVDLVALTPVCYYVAGVIFFCLFLSSLKADKRIHIGILFLIPLYISLFYSHSQIWAIAEKNSLATGVFEVIDTEVEVTEIQKWMIETCAELADAREAQSLTIYESYSSGWTVGEDTLPSGIVYFAKHARKVSFRCNSEGDFSVLEFDYPRTFTVRKSLHLVLSPEAAYGIDGFRSGELEIYFL